MSRERWIQAAIAAGLIAVVVWIARHTYWDEITFVTPPSGEAARDRYYSLAHLAAALGIETRRIGSLHALPPQGIVLAGSLHDDLRHEPIQNLQAWVQSGGRLIIGGDTLAASEALQTWSGIMLRPADRLPSPMPRALRSGLIAAPDCKPRSIAIEGVPDGRSLILCNALKPGLASERIASWSLSDADGIQALRVAIGRGELTVIGPTSILSNANLPDRDHAEIFVAAAGLKRGDRLEILSPTRAAPLPVLLWRLAAPAIVFLAAALALLILRHVPRFGPALPPVSVARCSLAEQIRTNARFSWRTRRLDSLRAAIRRALDEAAQKRIAGYTRMDPRRRALALSAVTGVDADTLAAALLDDRAGGLNEDRAAITLLEACRRMLIGADSIRGRHR